MECCAEKPQNSPWFDACKQGDIEAVNRLKAEYIGSREARDFSIKPLDLGSAEYTDVSTIRVRSFRYPHDIVLPQFTGLMYAVLYNQPKIVEILMKEELFINTEEEAFVPTQLESPFKQPIIENKRVVTAFQAQNVVNFAYVPPNSTVLDLCVFLDRLQLHLTLMEHISTLSITQQDQILQHINQHYQTNLMLMIRLPNPDSTQFLEKYGQLVIETQFDYENMIGENCSYIAAVYGNHRFFQYFLSLGSNPEYKDLIEVQLDQSQFQRDILDVFAKRRDHQSYQKCLKLYQMFLKQQYPPPPSWLNVRPSNEIIVNPTRPEQPELIDYEVLDELDPINMQPQMKPKFTGSIFEDRQESQKLFTDKIASQVTGSQKPRPSGSEILFAVPLAVQSSLKQQERRKSSFMKTPRFVTDEHNNTQIVYDMQEESDNHAYAIPAAQPQFAPKAKGSGLQNPLFLENRQMSNKVMEPVKELEDDDLYEEPQIKSVSNLSGQQMKSVSNQSGVQSKLSELNRADSKEYMVISAVQEKTKQSSSTASDAQKLKENRKSGNAPNSQNENKSKSTSGDNSKVRIMEQSNTQTSDCNDIVRLTTVVMNSAQLQIEYSD
ncbi:Conserved_hypothetical protein [Hexamita inflata]|uniref:Uncharacterized protein n=1 Tax=Hexamita inflata TaxID=28002 RepID=A0AA86NPB1_9EUKA|nr:Conserved hypothetical protein [Hexamita inflata]